MEFFSPDFFKTEFWLLWSTIMGSLPQHSVIEFRRYMNRFLYLFPPPVDHGGGDAHALQPERSVRKTSGRLASLRKA